MIPIWLEATVLGTLLSVIVADLALAYRRRRVPSVRESTTWIVVYSVLALGFAGLLITVGLHNLAGQFIAGWVTEYSLSLDNLFVFILIIDRFLVPRPIQEEVLLIGIIVALVLRGVFILLGVTLIAHFGWIFYLFGGFLLYTSVHQILPGKAQADEQEELRVIRWIRRRIPIAQRYNGPRLTVEFDGRRMLTPILLVVLAIGATDVLFAFDSIPAIFGITQNAAIVFAANLFALMGLRQLYFLLRTLISRLIYLNYGIAAILIFIGVKLVLHAMHTNRVPFINGGRAIEWAPNIGTPISLAVIIGAIAVAVAASLFKGRLTPDGD